MRILKAVEGSVLFLYAGSELVQSNLRREAAARGVDAQRLVFSGRLPLPEHLARYRAADLFLDTLPYNAGATASDALWAGLPVLTCTADAFASRVAASLLTAIELPELITATASEYESAAIALAERPAYLQDIRGRLAASRATTLLFDTARFTQHLELAYLQMYDRDQAGLPPDHIFITPATSRHPK
jgi:predicted O-linked N-acetylglucosamine transferase (SPINDLY family)